MDIVFTKKKNKTKKEISTVMYMVGLLFHSYIYFFAYIYIFFFFVFFVQSNQISDSALDTCLFKRKKNICSPARGNQVNINLLMESILSVQLHGSNFFIVCLCSDFFRLICWLKFNNHSRKSKKKVSSKKNQIISN